MLEDLYCTSADVYRYGGIKRGSLGSASYLVSSVDVDTNAFQFDEHGFEDGDTVQFRAESGGSLPSPLEEGEDYTVVVVGDHWFSVSSSGVVIDLTTEGENVLVIEESPIPSSIYWASRQVDGMIPSVVPLTSPYPAEVRMAVAELAAVKAASRRGKSETSLLTMLDEVRAKLSRWAKGVPIRGDNRPSSANLAMSSDTSTITDPRTAWRGLAGLS